MTKRVCIDLDSMIQGVIREVATHSYAGAVSPRLLPCTVGDEFKNLSREDFLAIDGFCRDCRLGHTLSGYMNGLESLASNNPKSEDLPLLIEYLNKVIRAHRQGSLEAAEAWLNALYVGLKAANVFLPKAQIAFKQSDALPAAQHAGGLKTKENSKPKKEKLRQKVTDYMAKNEPRRKERNLPKLTAKKCRDDLMEGNRVCGYAPSYALKLIQEIFDEDRPSSEAECDVV